MRRPNGRNSIPSSDCPRFSIVVEASAAFVLSDPRRQVGRSPNQAGPFRLGYNPGKQSRRQKTPRYSKTNIHPSAQPLAAIIPGSVCAGRDARQQSAPKLTEPLSGTDIFGPETAAENRTYPGTETATHKTTVGKPRQRRAFPVNL